MTEERIPVDTEKNKIVGGTLYLVATPIGNLADLSERAVKVLSEVDFIAAEDTRNTGKLLSILGISRPMVSYYEHNKRERGPVIVERLLAGESCALVSDAGTPAISDPGEDIVRLCGENGIPVTGVPGCCAAVNALSLSGLLTGRFAFEGFLPPSGAPRRERLEQLKQEGRTFILYEAPHRLRATLADLLAALGDRPIALCREMTKLNEEIHRTTISAAVTAYTEREPRGEYVLVVAGKDALPKEEGEEWFSALSPLEHVAHYEEEGMAPMAAIKAAARDRGMPKSELYRLIHHTEED